MVDKVKEIISIDIGDIINSPMSLVLLDCYSKLYLFGAQPRYCEKSIRQYYTTLCKSGLQKAKDMEEKTKSLNNCKKSGLKYVGTPLCKHFDLDNLTDGQAIILLEDGYLKEDDFLTLPKGYESKVKDKVKNTSEAPKETVPSTELPKTEQKTVIPQALKKDAILKLRKDDAVKYATDMAYPKKEWQELNKPNLHKYLISKI